MLKIKGIGVKDQGCRDKKNQQQRSAKNRVAPKNQEHRANNQNHDGANQESARERLRDSFRCNESSGPRKVAHFSRQRVHEQRSNTNAAQTIKSPRKTDGAVQKKRRRG